MSWTPNAKEIGSVFTLRAPARYQYCIKKIADQQLLWSLASNDGWLLLSDATGRALVPIWPHSAYALSCAEANWPDLAPRAIALAEWRGKWLSGIANDGRAIAVFPDLAGNGSVVEADRFDYDLTEELARFGEA